MITDEKLYLKELGEQLNQSIARIKKFTTVESNADLVKELNNIVSMEKKLRQQCGIGARFKVISAQLEGTFKKFSDRAKKIQQAMQQDEVKADTLSEDEVLIYVHLFNAQGSSLKNWQNLLLPHAMVNHSVNRPIYSKRNDIEKVLKIKPNKAQHSYLVVAVKKTDIVSAGKKEILHDNQGFELLRIKHGSLERNKIVEFVHDEKVYEVNSQGELSKKL